MVKQLKLEEFYARRGIELITPEAGMQFLARMLGQRPASLTVISANWALARENAPQGIPAMFQLLGKQAEGGATSEVDSDSLVHQLRTVEESVRQQIVASYLKELVARVLQLDGSQFTDQETLTNLGMDSMMAIEVKTRIAVGVKVDVSVLELLQGITIEQLAVRILSSLELSLTSEVISPLEEIQQLVEQADGEELERLLVEIEQQASGLSDLQKSAQVEKMI
jgi:aryl carrier-like protein